MLCVFDMPSYGPVWRCMYPLFVTSLKWREVTRAIARDKRSRTSHRARTLSVIETYKKQPGVEVSNAFRLIIRQRCFSR